MSHLDNLARGREARMARAAAEKAARIEDAAWMAETGEGLTNAARRLGVHQGSFEKYLRRHAPAILKQLQDQDFRDHNAATYRDGLGLHAKKRREPAA